MSWEREGETNRETEWGQYMDEYKWREGERERWKNGELREKVMDICVMEGGSDGVEEVKDTLVGLRSPVTLRTPSVPPPYPLCTPSVPSTQLKWAGSWRRGRL